MKFAVVFTLTTTNLTLIGYYPHYVNSSPLNRKQYRFVSEKRNKNSFTLSKSCMKTEQFFFYSEKQSLLTVELKNLTTKQRKTPSGFDAAFLPNGFQVVEKLCERNY